MPQGRERARGKVRKGVYPHPLPFPRMIHVLQCAYFFGPMGLHGCPWTGMRSFLTAKMQKKFPKILQGKRGFPVCAHSWRRVFRRGSRRRRRLPRGPPRRTRRRRRPARPAPRPRQAAARGAAAAGGGRPTFPSNRGGTGCRVFP